MTSVCILFAGVVSRYVLDSPLFWTDELESQPLSRSGIEGRATALS